ncbi:MAG: acetyl-CoA hydrolase/transferase family protein [Anaerovoracaceae bacterium]
MDWKKIYEERQCSLHEAVSEIKSGDRIVLGHAASIPMELERVMVENADDYRNVRVCHMVTLGKGEYTDPKYKDNFTFEGWFSGPTTRKCIEQGHGEFVPVFFHEVPILIRRGIFPIDVTLIKVSPPDEHGFCCIGVESGYTMQAVKSAKKVIAEVSDQVPVVYGDDFVHVSEIAKFAITNAPVPELPLPKIGPVEEAIGKNCASLIDDGSTLQLGIGAIPDAVLSQLKGKKDLGIHSEMISDGVVDLYEAGVVNCTKKSIDKGKMVVAFLMGSRRLYDFVDHNPAIEMRPVDYVNHPEIIAKCGKMVSVNACLEVDFVGQVVADSIGHRQFSGVGGQVDFVRGTAMSHDGLGKSIIAMPSSAVKKDGTRLSKIKPDITPGAAVTTTRNDVDYIVTEYGIARMKGVTIKDRARSLIDIAHPDFREELKIEFEKRFNDKY